MGTRGLLAIQLDGEYKIAVYNQFDSYPSELGITVLGFLRSLDWEGWLEFVEGAKRIKTIDQDGLDGLEDCYRLRWGTEWDERLIKDLPQFSIHVAHELLPLIKQGVVDIGPNEIEFANDSLFCEWGYVIDLDAGKLEVYKGFNHRRTKKGSRFYTKEPHEVIDGHKYWPIRLVAEYLLSALPTNREFTESLESDKE